MSDRAPEVRLDFARASRTGLDEAVLCAGKSTAQLETILSRVRDAGRRILMTRLDDAAFAALAAEWRAEIDRDPVSRTGFFGAPARPTGPAAVAVVSAGASDAPVAREAERTLAFAGVASETVFDVGVAGLWRLLDRVERLRAMRVLIVVAGMDAALPSVVAGLAPAAIVAVPTSTGYGVAAGGETALRAILASCSPGVVAVNIDNGYGAACAALRILAASDTPPRRP